MSDGEISPFSFNFGTVKYKVDYSTNSTDMNNDSVKQAVYNCFQKWKEVSSFNFVETDSEDWNIFLEFGPLPDDVDSNVLAIQAFAKDSYTGQAVPDKKVIIFRNSLKWKNLEDEFGPEGNSLGGGYNWIAFLGNIGSVDLMTIAMHEVGHALGLDHIIDDNSIMQAQLGIGSSIYFFKRTRSLADVDAQALAEIYRKSFPPVVPRADGYAIVGSTFQMSNLRSSSTFLDIPELCWGVREGTPSVAFFAGYGWNPRLGTEGFGALLVHLLPPGELNGRPFVIGGGVIKPRTNISSLNLPSEVLNTYSVVGGVFMDPTWGQQAGLMKVVGRVKSFNKVTRTDTDSLIYFVLGSDGTHPPAKLKGFSASAGSGDETLSNPRPLRSWGYQKDGETFLGSGRTYFEGMTNTNGLNYAFFDFSAS